MRITPRPSMPTNNSPMRCLRRMWSGGGTRLIPISMTTAARIALDEDVEVHQDGQRDSRNDTVNEGVSEKRHSADNHPGADDGEGDCGQGPADQSPLLERKLKTVRLASPCHPRSHDIASAIRRALVARRPMSVSAPDPGAPRASRCTDPRPRHRHRPRRRRRLRVRPGSLVSAKMASTPSALTRSMRSASSEELGSAIV